MLPDGSKALRYALGAIKNVGGAAMKALVAEREANGPFASVQDFVNRLDKEVINKRRWNIWCKLVRLINSSRTGRFCSSTWKPWRAMHTRLLKSASSQVNLFGGTGGQGDAPELRLIPAEEWPLTDKLHREFQSIGFTSPGIQCRLMKLHYSG